MSLSQRILEDNRDVSARMLDHRFVTEIVADRLPTAVFHRYLQDEAAFVGTAVEILARALAAAPDIGAQRHLIAGLDGLADEQLPYFERIFARIGVKTPVPVPAHPDVRAFIDGMVTVARGGRYLDIIAVMFAAEWMYATWCARAAGHPPSDPDLAHWIALHVAPPFLAQVAWLRGELDRHDALLSAAERSRLSGLFALAMRLEIGFHDAAFRVPGSRQTASLFVT